MQHVPFSEGLKRPVCLMSVPVLVSVAAVLTSGLSACGPSINQAARADIDRRVATLSQSAASFSAPRGFEPMPIGVGQWAEYKVVGEDGKPAFVQMKIVGQQGDAYWFEMENYSYYGRSAFLYLMTFGDRRNPETVEIRAMRQMDNEGRIQEPPPQLLGLMQSVHRQSLSLLMVSWENQAQESVVVPAGSFSGCFKVKSDVEILGFRSATTNWSHPEVPIAGLVRSQGLDKPTTMELVGFGTSGARSLFPGM